ncbi:filamentous hemagglutinin N-terminal domain-containing protein [Nostoc sp. UHCC 0251]|uniref:filamentous hemagglutinin N-terminal domain-containing protein n=1 Tax=Nostoc sp. UHCC 0251 TaxID=3110240 RepID=UPI002B21661F|nr:filamentous hemagglutinin N-terminal domain-containing protein [Nostoc sp. UHCC 0251]MEA5624392.1 filamentous hemagglutinin N-terminal domain-containing protein [Nostoc sp. UHCC 0251]
MAIYGYKKWHSNLLGVFSIIGVLAHVMFYCENYALAQITPDATLGDRSSKITPNVNIKGLPANQIDGGTIRGANLFHSFQEFNVGELQRVYFANPTGISNILTRVTGSNISNILGTLGVNGGANLFFLNPNGILFGNNARLDVQGSFVGTTANGLQFGNQELFSAINPQAPSLLTVNVPIGLQYGRNPGAIQLQEASLQVPNGRTLTLAGGIVNIDGRELLAPGGRVELAGVASSGGVGLMQQGQELRLSVPEGLARADVSMTNGANVDVRAGGGGS